MEICSPILDISSLFAHSFKCTNGWNQLYSIAVNLFHTRDSRTFCYHCYRMKQKFEIVSFVKSVFFVMTEKQFNIEIRWPILHFSCLFIHSLKIYETNGCSVKSVSHTRYIMGWKHFKIFAIVVTRTTDNWNSQFCQVGNFSSLFTHSLKFIKSQMGNFFLCYHSQLAKVLKCRHNCHF